MSEEEQQKIFVLSLKVFAVWLVLVVVFNILKKTSKEESKSFKVSKMILNLLYGIMAFVIAIFLIIFGGPYLPLMFGGSF